MNSATELTYKTARRIAVFVVGATVLAVGIILLVAPGPAIIVIPLGLAILGIEFAWARNWLRKVRAGISSQATRHRSSKIERHRRPGRD